MFPLLCATYATRVTRFATPTEKKKRRDLHQASGNNHLVPDRGVLASDRAASVSAEAVSRSDANRDWLLDKAQSLFNF